MATEKVKAKDMTEFNGPVDTGNPHGKGPADKKNGDANPDESVSKSTKKGADLPGTTTVGEEVAALFDGVEGLSEGFVERASTIVEGALSEKISILREEMEEEYNTKLEEAYSEIADSLETKLDEYLNLFVENYLTENKIAIERGFRNELAESVIESFASIVEAAGVQLSDDKVDLADALAEENATLEGKYNEALNETIELKKEIRKYQVNEAFDNSTVGLSDASKEKLRKLTENINYDNVEQYTQKLEVLKEQFTDGAAIAPVKDITEASDEHAPVDKTVDPRMNAYITATLGSIRK